MKRFDGISNINYFIIIIFLFALSGCAAPKLVANKELIKNFSPPIIVDQNESLVYVIRQPMMLGAARGLYVSLNDQVIGDIGSGKYCFFKVKKGINSINTEQQIIGDFFPIDHRAGETIFLSYDYAKGQLTELEKEIGMTSVMQNTNAPLLDSPKKNNFYSTGVMNPSVMKYELMKNSDAKLLPSNSEAVVTFIRHQSFAEGAGIGIWSDNDFLGTLKGQSYFQIKLPAGKHHFIAKLEHYSIVEAEVEVGKNYYIEVDANMGWAQPHIKLLPVKADMEQTKIDGWLKSSKLVVLDSALVTETVKARFDLAKPLIAGALKDVSTGKKDARYLKAGDGRAL